MNTNICFLCLVQYGTRGKCPSFCCNSFFVSLSNCRLMHMSIPYQSNSMRQARQGTDLMRVRRRWVYCGGALSSVARRRNISDPDIMVPVL